jgi:hypothetical protein
MKIIAAFQLDPDPRANPIDPECKGARAGVELSPVGTCNDAAVNQDVKVTKTVLAVAIPAIQNPNEIDHVRSAQVDLSPRILLDICGKESLVTFEQIPWSILIAKNSAGASCSAWQIGQDVESAGAGGLKKKKRGEMYVRTDFSDKQKQKGD